QIEEETVMSPSYTRSLSSGTILIIFNWKSNVSKCYYQLGREFSNDPKEKQSVQPILTISTAIALRNSVSAD
ncbi:unnamed protein product, partial [Allacma fusca]